MNIGWRYQLVHHTHNLKWKSISNSFQNKCNKNRQNKHRGTWVFIYSLRGISLAFERLTKTQPSKASATFPLDRDQGSVNRRGGCWKWFLLTIQQVSQPKILCGELCPLLSREVDSGNQQPVSQPGEAASVTWAPRWGSWRAQTTPPSPMHGASLSSRKGELGPSWRSCSTGYAPACSHLYVPLSLKQDLVWKLFLLKVGPHLQWSALIPGHWCLVKRIRASQPLKLVKSARETLLSGVRGHLDSGVHECQSLPLCARLYFLVFPIKNLYRVWI